MRTDQDDAAPTAELSHAGAVVDKAIGYMLDQSLGELAIASALLGGSLALLSHSMADEDILRILDNARASIRAGEFRAVSDPPPGPRPERP